MDTQKIVDRMNTASGEKMSTKSKKLVFVSGVNNWDETQLSKDLWASKVWASAQEKANDLVLGES